ncbi:ComEA family DNA-binding protein [Granulicella arctica]|uniref:ComEA family DNA-binding protein n=1 Tax=Granulicella arctica TaxID=940613 RepID=UPI0021DFF548|nr:helix-hairpin-helix domain-containing protein [Granulicella arctica]
MNRFSRFFLAFVLFAAATAGSFHAQPAFASSVGSIQASTTADADKLDINTATADQLKALKGIGDAYSKRIIAGRPYTAKNQLTSRGILPVATYNAVKDQIIAKQPKK